MYRTEFLFTSKDRFPSENEQYEDYIKLFSNNDFNDITIRTLDIGGDKLIHKNDDEANPAMGLRGIRYSLSNIEIFKKSDKSNF